MKELEIAPSDGVLTSLRWKLFFSDFFSLNLRKFNLGYLLLAISASIGASAILIHKHEPVNTASVIPVQNSIQSTTVRVPENTAETLPVEKEKSSEPKTTMQASAKVFFSLNAENGCAPFTVQLINESQNSNSYKWSFGNGTTSAENNPVCTYTEPGSYTIQLSATGGNGKSGSYKRTVNVYAKPEAEFKIDIEGSDNASRKIKFANASVGADSFNWSFGDKTTSRETNPEHIYANHAVYPVSLIAVSEHGCADTTFFVNRFVEKNYALVFPETFKPNLSSRNNGFYERAENRAFVFFPDNNGVSSYSLVITGPSGIEIFKTEDINKGWNGYFRGRIVPHGFYKYSATGLYPNGEDFSVSGEVEIIVDKEYDGFYAQ